jgi:DNA polymerase I-like protein with 3'-5' exonuclease and polymerase domains
VDVESTIFQKGNPFARRNKLCYVGALSETGTCIATPTSELSDFRRAIAGATLLVGFNFKFDLHWLRRIGIAFEHARVWDCQLARFLLEAQRVSLKDNSLAEACGVYGASPKSSHIEENYWSKGIDTPDIPQEEMLAYLRQDLKSTMEVYQAQRKLIEADPRLTNLFKLDMDDLLVLQEMEYNGLKFNMDKAKEEEEKARKRVEEIERELQSRCPNTPINWDSGDDLSAYLYGGNIVVEYKEPVGVFKTGAKVGEVRFKRVEQSYTIPRLVEPMKGSELKKGTEKDGPWSTAEDVLKQVKQVKEVKLILERAKLTKLLDYLIGFPELMVEKDWPPGMLHGQFNQCIARTGRLSSSSPNLQNLPDPILQLVETRYA